MSLGGLAGKDGVQETRKRIILPNGSAIWCKSAEKPDNLRGEGVDDLTLDEAAYIKNLDYVWRGILRPMLIDSGGTMASYSTPNRRNEFYKWFIAGQDPLKVDWASWNFPTSANPYLPKDELEKLLQEYPPGSELYRQELLGEFLEGAGAVFRKIREAAIAPRPASKYDGGRYVCGIDWGKSRDFTVIVVLDSVTGVMVDMDRFNIVDYTVQRDRIGALWQRWDIQFGYAETNAMGEPNLEMLQADGLTIAGFTTTAQSKRPLIEGLAQALELGSIKIFDDPILISELEVYERKVSPVTGAPMYSAPSGSHDDTVMGLALAWAASQEAYDNAGGISYSEQYRIGDSPY